MRGGYAATHQFIWKTTNPELPILTPFPEANRLFIRTLNIHEDGWGRVAIVPQSNPDLPLMAQKISYTVFQALTADTFFPVSQVTCVVDHYIENFQKTVFGFVQDIDQGCALYGLQEYGVIQTLCLASATRTIRSEAIQYADILDRIHFSPTLSDTGSTDPNFAAIARLLAILGKDYAVTLQDTWHSPQKLINLQDERAIEAYLRSEG